MSNISSTGMFPGTNAPAAAPLSDAQLRAYLERIGLGGLSQDAQPARELLDRLVFAHQCSIPFSTAGIVSEGRPPALDVPSLFTKLVKEGRGGFCFELNMLFEKLLLALGYDARACLCRSVRGREAPTGINHRAELVSCDGELLFADVGFGGPMCAKALPVRDGAELDDGSHRFFCRRLGKTWWAVDRATTGPGDMFGDDCAPRRQTELLFCTAFVDDGDFALLSCALSQPGSLFRDHVLVNLRTPDGYIACRDLELRQRGAVSRTETFATPEERDAALSALFKGRGEAALGCTR